jgi:hypothetical protein
LDNTEKDPKKVVTEPVLIETGKEGDLSRGQELMRMAYNGPSPDYQLIDHVALILWDHGGGKQFGLLQDRDNIMPFDELKATLIKVQDHLKALGMKRPCIDLLVFDACLMGTYEVAAELAELPFIHYMVASERTVPAFGLPYDTIVDYINTHNPSPKDLGKHIVNAYFNTYRNYDRGASLSLIDPYYASKEKREQLKTAYNDLNFIQQLAVMIKSTGFSRHFYNAVTFSRLVKLYSFNETHKAYADQFLQSVEDMVIYNKSHFKEAGLCIEKRL